MAFEEEIRQIDQLIERGYLDLVVDSYKPLFERLKRRAVKHMNSERISEIDLGVHSVFVFKEDGKFYDRKNKSINLRELPGIYQQESDYNAGCADHCSHVTPSIHYAMRSALFSFREKIKDSIADVI